MNLKTTIIIAKKEFFSFINNSFSYVLAVPFLFLTTFIYIRSSLVVGEASMRSFFELLPWFLVLLAPALSMKIVNDEETKRTLELLLSHPISEIDIVLGKYFGVFLFYLFLMLFTLPLPVFLFIFANPDVGVIISQYLGGLLSGLVFLSIGILTSSLVLNPIGSFLLSASISFALILVGLEFVTLMFPSLISFILSELSILTHVGSISRGLLDTRDLLYFVTLSATALTIAVYKLSSHKIKERKVEERRLKASIVLIIGISILLNIFLYSYPLRVDLTKQKLFTLSKGTKEIAVNLPDIVTITLFTSKNLPASFQITLREVEDLLSSYEKLSNKIRIKTAYPDQDTKQRQLASTLGIEEIVFNRIQTGKFEVQTGYLGIGIFYGNESGSIPFVQSTSNLEYQLTRKINKLVEETDKAVGIYQNSIGSFQQLTQVLKDQYEIVNISKNDFDNKEKLKSLTSIILIDDGQQTASMASYLKISSEEVKNILLLVDGVSVNSQFLQASENPNDPNSFLETLGIKLNNDLIYDVELNETLTFTSGRVNYLVPYPFFLKAIPDDKSLPAVANIESLTLPWPSSLSLETKEETAQTKLLSSSETAGQQKESYSISPDQMQSLPSPQKNRYTFSVLAQKNDLRLIIVSDTDFVKDSFVQNFPENLSFAANTADFLSSEGEILNIKSKVESRPFFSFPSPIFVVFYQYANLLIPIAAILIFAIFWLRRRKMKFLRKYEKK